MPVVHNPESGYSKELLRWNLRRDQYLELPDGSPDYSKPGYRPVGHEQFPLMLYKAVKNQNGKLVCMESLPSPYGFADAAQYDRACLAAEHFTKQCQKIVRSESEERDAKRQGWKDTPDEALAHAEGLEVDIANAAAEAQYAAQRMSTKARAELEAAEAAAGPNHATDVDESTKRGWSPARRAAFEQGKQVGA